MTGFYTAPENLLFTGAFVLLILLAALQVVSLLFGFGLSSAVDQALPDIDLDADLDVDVDTDFDLLDTAGHSTSFMAGVLSWMNLGRVPFLVSVAVFLMLFSFLGFIAQTLLLKTGIGLLPAWMAAPPVFFLALLPWREANRLMARVIPKDETAAVSPRRFIGRIASITIGTVTHERSAEAKLVGPLGRTHYLMVLADNEGDQFQQGDHVLVVGRKGAVFTVIANPNPHLEDVT